MSRYPRFSFHFSPRVSSSILSAFLAVISISACQANPFAHPLPPPPITGQNCGAIIRPIELTLEEETLHDVGTAEMIQCFQQAYTQCKSATIRFGVLPLGATTLDTNTSYTIQSLDNHCNVHVVDFWVSGHYYGTDESYDCPILQRKLFGLFMNCVGRSTSIIVPYPNFSGTKCGREKMVQVSTTDGVSLTEPTHNEYFADFDCFIQAYQQCQPAVMVFDAPDMNVKDPTNPEIVERVSGLHRFTIHQGSGGCFVQDDLGVQESYVASYPCDAMTVEEQTIHFANCGIEGNITISYKKH